MSLVLHSPQTHTLFPKVLASRQTDIGVWPRNQNLTLEYGCEFELGVDIESRANSLLISAYLC